MVGGVVVWVVGEQVRDGSETGTSPGQRLFFKSIGFRLRHTMVMTKKGTRSPGNVRYGLPLEYAFILSKEKPRSVNLIRDKANKYAGQKCDYYQRRQGRLIGEASDVVTAPWGVRTAIWEYVAGSCTASEKIAFAHPALMPEPMAEDHIVSWSRPGDMVFDPFAGAGTTLKMAMLNNRRYLGMEIEERYCEIAQERLRLATGEHKRRLDEFLFAEADN